MSPNSQRTTLGDLEEAAMRVLWDAGAPMTVREVHLQLCTQRRLAYTTVMTVLDRLAKKDLLDRDRDGRAWRYRPASSRKEVAADMLRSALGHLPPEEQTAALLQFLDDAPREQIDHLNRGLLHRTRKV